MKRPDFLERVAQARRTAHRKYLYAIASVVIFLAFAIYLTFASEAFQRHYLYPFPYRDTVETYSDRYRVDPYLAIAVIKTESKFQDGVHSHRGAIGLMQLMPDTAAWIAKQLDDQDFSLERLHEPDMNIRYGTWYLSSLRDEFQGNEVLMLAAYNAGRGNVHEWMDTYGWTMDFSAVDEIPYEETKAYVASVLKNKKKYEALYGKNGS